MGSEVKTSDFDLEKQKLIKPEETHTFPLSITYQSNDVKVKWQDRSWKTRPKPPPAPKPVKTSTILILAAAVSAILIAMIVVAIVFQQCNYKCISIYQLTTNETIQKCICRVFCCCCCFVLFFGLYCFCLFVCFLPLTIPS